MTKKILPLIAGAALALSAANASAATLDDVKAKGFIQCGVNTGLLGFASTNDKGEWAGFDIDYCKAVAAAVFGDATKVRFSPLNATERFTALQSGEVDVLIRNSTWTMSRDTSLGLMFIGVNYYDGQGFMVRKDLNVASAKDLGGASVCVQTGTTTELNLADYFQANNMEYNLVAFAEEPAVEDAYEGARCDVFTTDASGLYGIRLTLANPDDHIVLPEIISEEPLGPVVRQGDDQWFSIVKWVHFALINAEEAGITQANVEEMKTTGNQDVKRILGVDGTFGEGLGLGNDWAANIIKAVGNYGEIFERNVGAGSPLKIERGLNALWTNGGLQYAPPVR